MSEERRISKSQARAVKAFLDEIAALAGAYRTLGMAKQAEGMEKCASIAVEMLTQKRKTSKAASPETTEKRRAAAARATAARMAKRQAVQS